MRSNYRKIGEYIREVDKRNSDLKVTDLRGLSMTKEFRESTSNIVGTDMSVYKVMHKWQFACDFMSPIRVSKLPVVLKMDDKPNLVSPAYPVFEVIDRTKLDAEYLMMWFRRSEFDRYATFKCDSAIRGGYNWDELCDTDIPVPHIDKQRELVKEYNTIVNRINLNNQLIQKLEEMAQAIYKQWFVDFEFPDENGQPYKSSGGEMEWCEELGKEVPLGWESKSLKSICSKIGSGATPDGGKENYKNSGISLIRSMNVYDFAFYENELAYIDEMQANELKNVIVEEGDILFNITGVSVARCCMAPASVLPARVNQHVMILRVSKEIKLRYYLLCHLCSSETKNKLLGISQSGSTREAITKSEMEEYLIIKPEDIVAKLFEGKAHSIFLELQNLNRFNRCLKDLQDVLLSKISTI